MRHAIVNLTWTCQLHCDYCWLPHVDVTKDRTVHTADEWADALAQEMVRGDRLEFVGGEPTLFKGFHQLAQSVASRGIEWAVTSNVMNTKVIEQFINDPVPLCVCWSVSLHAGNRSAWRNADMLEQRGYSVARNVVIHEGAPDTSSARVSYRIPYQAWKEHLATDGKKRNCDAGKFHFAVAPNGDIYRCSVHLQLDGVKPIGNLFTREVQPLADPLCTTGCTSCYTSHAGSWCVTMEELDATDS